MTMSLLPGFLTGLVMLAATLALVDLVSGLAHWAEDTFGTEATPVLGKWIVTPNLLHHRDGTAFVANSWLKSSWDLLAAAVAIVAIAWSIGMLSWPVWVFAVVGANANQIHKWNHMPRARRPFLIRALQWLRLLQSSRDHVAHHRGEKNSAYCVITPLLNPLLDRMQFWHWLERLTVPTLGAPRRTDLHHLTA